MRNTPFLDRSAAVSTSSAHASIHGHALACHRGHGATFRIGNDAVLILEQNQFGGILGIVDADFAVIELRPSPSPNILFTDLHDIECMTLHSPALDHLMREMADADLVTHFERTHKTSVTEHLLSIGGLVGYMRWISIRLNWSLKFEGLKFKTFIREKSFCSDVADVVKAVRNHQGRSRSNAITVPSHETILAEMTSLMTSSHDLWHVCSGHDLVEILSIGLRRVLGKNNECDVKPAWLEQQLRLAYETSYFRKSRLYDNIVSWQHRNVPFQVC